MKKPYLILPAVALLLVGPVQAQQSEMVPARSMAMAAAPSSAPTARGWTLEECIAYAREHSLDMHIRELAAESKRLALAESKWGYAPNVSLSGGYNLSTGRVLDPTTYNFIENQTVQGVSGSLSAAMTLFGGMQNLYQLRRAKLDLRSELLGIEKAWNDVRLNITASYLEILCAKEYVRDAQQLVETLRLQEQHTSKLVEAHKVTSADLLQVQSQLADAENDLFTAINLHSVAMLNLCHLLDYDDYERFDIATPPDQALSPAWLPDDVATVQEAAMALPQIGQAHTVIGLARRDLQLARTAYSPTISLSAGYGSSYSDARQKMFQNPDGTYRYEQYAFGDQFMDNASSYISLSLQIPIFNRLSVRHTVRSRKIALRQAEYSLRVQEKQLLKEVNQAYIDAQTAWEKYLASRKYVASASEAFRQIGKKYNMGAATMVDYSVAVGNLVKANGQLSRSKYEYIFKIKMLDFYLHH